MVLVTHDQHEARRVAELVGMQNHFQGQFFQQGADDAPGFDRLMWHGASLDERLSLRVPDKKRLDPGAQMSWVVAGELLDLSVHADPLALNTLACTLREVLPLGEISLCKSEPAQLPSQRITLNLSSAALRQLGAVPGARLYLRIPPAAAHIMPVRFGLRIAVSRRVLCQPCLGIK